MNGPEHFRKAEELSVRAHDTMGRATTNQELREANFCLELARVHALLALTQATIDAAPSAHSLTEWGKRHAEAKAPVIEETGEVPFAVLHTPRAEEHRVPVAGTDTVRAVWGAVCGCGLEVVAVFDSKQVALSALAELHVKESRA